MNLECLNDIVRQNLAIYIDLTSLNSWDLNTGFTSISLTKWTGAVSDNINLFDFGLTGFDNGRMNEMYKGIVTTPSETKLVLHRVGYNVITNPASGDTSGATAITMFDQYPISAVTSGNTGNYFRLNGGYLQGFFKLYDYNYELFPSRYNNGITIETLIEILPDSEGIFYLMGTRAEDKYEPYFSGETTLVDETIVFYAGNETGKTDTFSGVVTSENHFLTSEIEENVVKSAFRRPEDMMTTIDITVPQIDNIRDNIISFELTQDKRIAYKLINSDGLIVTNTSDYSIPYTGWTLISITFTPYDIIPYFDPKIENCYSTRLGEFKITVNGRTFWKIKDFKEFYFTPLKTEREKQIGVPYNISWGGGSFGLKHSWHYDKNTYNLYNGEDISYINNKFFVTYNPLATNCATSGTTDIYQSGLTLSANTTVFTTTGSCDPSILIPETVMEIKHTGQTGQTGATSYFIKFNQPIEILSNRVYDIGVSLFDTGMFMEYNPDGSLAINNISLLVYGSEDISVVNEVVYQYPLTMGDVYSLLKVDPNSLTYDEYEYVKAGIKYYGLTNLLVYPVDVLYELGYSSEAIQIALGEKNSTVTTGLDKWNNLNLNIELKPNTGKQTIYIGLLIESSTDLVLEQPLYVKNFSYTGSDIYAQDHEKDNLLIEQNFNSSYIGNVQKLRVYDRALNSMELLNNALVESKINPALNIRVSKGGRIIYV